MIDSNYMEILDINKLDEKLFEHLMDDSQGKSIISTLASSQTGNDRTITRERMNYVKKSLDHLMLLAVQDDDLKGMTIAQKITGISNSYIYIHDIVVAEDQRGKGVGSNIIIKLMAESQKKWPEAVKFQLTSRPSRGTGPFFQKLGFRPRTKEAGDETIVYVKDLGDYKS